MKPADKEKWFKVGLKFTATSFGSLDREVYAIREERNEVDIILIPSDGHAWLEKNLNIDDIKLLFERKEYIITEPNEVNISVI